MSRTMCASWRCIISRLWTATAASSRHAEHVEAGPDGGERVPKLVGEGGQEFVLAPVGISQRLLGALAVGHVLGHAEDDSTSPDGPNSGTRRVA